MKNLIYKELKLAIHPAIYLFALLSVLLLIPNYPYAIGMFYWYLGMQIVFQMAKANKDLEFTANLPVSRNAVVMSKHLSTVIIQLAQIIAAVPFALISSLLINKSGNPTGLDANFVFFGVTLIAYSAFNIACLPRFYKSGYKLGLPLLSGIAAYAAIVLAFEIAIALVPVLKTNLDSLNPNTFIYQIPFFIVCIIIYAGTLIGSYKLSVKNFKKVSL